MPQLTHRIDMRHPLDSMLMRESLADKDMQQFAEDLSVIANASGRARD